MRTMEINKILKVIFSICLITFLVCKIDYSKILDLSCSIILYFFVSICVTLFSLYVMTIRWNLLLNEYLNIAIRKKKLYKYYLIGSFFNIFMPGAIGGDVVRVQRLSSRHNVSIKSATSIALVERFAGIYGLIVLLSLCLICRNFPQDFDWTAGVPNWILCIIPLIVISLIPILKFILDRFHMPSSYSFLVKTVFVLLVSQFGDIVIAYLFSLYFDLQLAFSSFIFIMPLVYIATVIPISFGGLGMREGTFSGLMVLYGIDTSYAIIISLLMYFVKVTVGIIGYFVYITDK